jgi:phage baseplate assembly protein W
MAATRVLSNQDGDLSKVSLVTTRNRAYKDIDLSFTRKPNGELYTKTDAAAVQQSIKNLILTNHFEKPFQPFFGGNIRALLFELADDDVEDDVRENIIDTVESYEPRVILRNIQVNLESDINTLRVSITYQVISTEEEYTFTTAISRLR